VKVIEDLSLDVDHVTTPRKSALDVLEKDKRTSSTRCSSILLSTPVRFSTPERGTVAADAPDAANKAAVTAAEQVKRFMVNPKGAGLVISDLLLRNARIHTDDNFNKKKPQAQRVRGQ
jgi:hypothetical protein